ncbi:MAG TPA: DJ-1/PfpI family protein [Paracoccaceae bacterium]|nr:DJ-1/PfpI family protein [Paracoccaceae bacterium]
MKIGLALFPGLCQLDMTGPHEVMARYPGAEVSVVAATMQAVTTDRGLTIRPDAKLWSAPQFDIFVMPGGPGQQALMEDEVWREFLVEQAQGAQVMMGVCTGSLVLGAAGLLKGYRATTHWGCHDLLALLGAKPAAERVVIDRDRVTAAGVTSGIDGALALAAHLFGREVAERIQLGMEYAPAPPTTAGHPDTAPAALVAGMREKGAGLYAARREACMAAAARLGLAAPETEESA